MKDLENLRKLMIQNGMIEPAEGKAGSFSIIPFGGPFFVDEPPDEPVEGGGNCSGACSPGCQITCKPGCEITCQGGCPLGCQDCCSLG